MSFGTTNVSAILQKLISEKSMKIGVKVMNITLAFQNQMRFISWCANKQHHYPKMNLQKIEQLPEKETEKSETRYDRIKYKWGKRENDKNETKKEKL